MRKLLKLLGCLAVAGALTVAALPAGAQSERGNLSDALDRLQDSKRYQGQIIGTQIRRTRDGAVLEVQILRDNDRVIVVYIDPATGNVVGDSSRRNSGPNRGRRRGDGN